MQWRVLVALLVLVALVAGGVTVGRLRSASALTYATVPLVRGDLVQTVTSTGTVNPQNTIAIGSQESGVISEIDADFNSRVRKGQVLAKLDPTTFAAALASARAALAQAQSEANASAASATGAQSSAAGAAQSAQAARATAQAARETAAMNRAAVAAAGANVTKAQSALGVAQQTVNRDESLLAQGYVAQSQLDTDRSNLVAAQSAAQSAVTAVRQAQLLADASSSQAAASGYQTGAQSAAIGTAQSAAAQQAASAAAARSAVAIAAANVQTAEQNLARTVITSPVNGTVISRTATVGETVAASFQTPTLFSIAQDLKKMEVDLAVGEPDIGAVRPGESVDFTVLAFPNRVFAGTVSQVRKNSVVSQNVVTYTTVVQVGNADGTLLPGMTANATIATAKAPHALVVPLAALSYAPPAGATSRRRRHQSAGAQSPAGATPGSAAPGTAGSASPWGAASGAASVPASAGGRGRIFVQRGGALVRVPVAIVLTNATQAAVTARGGATLTAGDAAVVGDSSAQAGGHGAPGAGANRNPLTGGGGPSGLRGMH